jgi:hypothetical protein
MSQGLKLGHFHSSIAALLAGTTVNTNFELGGAFALAKLAGVTVTKVEHRPEVVEALGLVKAAIGKAVHLKRSDREMVSAEIDNAIAAIGAHPHELSKAHNGGAEEIPTGGFMADQHEAIGGEAQAR